MRYVNGLAGLVLLGIAWSSIGEPDWRIWLPAYGLGSIIALSALKARMPTWLAWLCAAGAAGAMFAYFSLFFQIAPHLRGDWISHGHACLNLVVAAFCMIPVLAEFSRKLKLGPDAETASAPAAWPLRAALARWLGRLDPRRSATPQELPPTTR